MNTNETESEKSIRSNAIRHLIARYGYFLRLILSRIPKCTETTQQNPSFTRWGPHKNILLTKTLETVFFPSDHQAEALAIFVAVRSSGEAEVLTRHAGETSMKVVSRPIQDQIIFR